MNTHITDLGQKLPASDRSFICYDCMQAECSCALRAAARKVARRTSTHTKIAERLRRAANGARASEIREAMRAALTYAHISGISPRSAAELRGILRAGPTRDHATEALAASSSPARLLVLSFEEIADAELEAAKAYLSDQIAVLQRKQRVVAAAHEYGRAMVEAALAREAAGWQFDLEDEGEGVLPSATIISPKGDEYRIDSVATWRVCDYSFAVKSPDGAPRFPAAWLGVADTGDVRLSEEENRVLTVCFAINDER